MLINSCAWISTTAPSETLIKSIIFFSLLLVLWFQSSSLVWIHTPQPTNVLKSVFKNNKELSFFTPIYELCSLFSAKFLEEGAYINYSVYSLAYCNNIIATLLSIYDVPCTMLHTLYTLQFNFYKNPIE